MARSLNNPAARPTQTETPLHEPQSRAGVSPAFSGSGAWPGQARRLPYSVNNHQLPSRLRVALVDTDQTVHKFVRQAFAAHGNGWLLDTHRSPDSLGAALGHWLTALPPAGGHIPHPHHPPDVVLMEAQWPGFSDPDCARRLMARLPELRIVVFTTSAERETIVQSLIAGALGYIVKPAAPAYLLWAVTEAAQGRPVLCSEAQSAVMDFIHHVGASRQCRTLSAREREILLLLMNGATNKDIASHLGIGDGTVHWHLDNIFKKMHVHSREDARRKFVGGGEFLLPGSGLKTYHFPTLPIRLFSC